MDGYPPTGATMGPPPMVGGPRPAILSAIDRFRRGPSQAQTKSSQLRHKADEVLENLGYMRGGRVTRKMASLIDDVADMSREKLMERRQLLNLRRPPAASKQQQQQQQQVQICNEDTQPMRAQGGECRPQSLEDVLLNAADAEASGRRAAMKQKLLIKLGIRAMGGECAEVVDNHRRKFDPRRFMFGGASENSAMSTKRSKSVTGASSAGISDSVREKLRKKFDCPEDLHDNDCFKPLQSTVIESVVRTGVSTQATVDLRTLMSATSGGGAAATGGAFDHFRNVFYLVECFPRFVEEYNFAMQTLFHCPKMPAFVFYDGLVKLGMEEKLQYFRMTDAERGAIWDGWTEEGPKKPRRRAEIDFFKQVTDPSVKNGDILKMPHPENRVVMRGANLIIDTRNTEHHFFAKVYSRGSGKNNVVNNIVFNKLTKRVEMDSDVRKTHLPERSPNEDLELCDDEIPEEYDSDDDPMAEFRCPETGHVQRPVRCNY